MEANVNSYRSLCNSAARPKVAATIMKHLCQRLELGTLIAIMVIVPILACGRTDSSQCDGFDTECPTSAVPDWSVPATLPLPAQKEVTVPYSNLACLNHFVAEIDLSERNLEDLYYVRSWPDSALSTQAQCEAATFTVVVRRKVASSSGLEEWEAAPFDEYSVQGVWQNDACNSRTVPGKTGGAYMSEGKTNDEIGYPVGWVDTASVDGKRVLAAQLVLAGQSDCKQLPIAVQFRRDP